MAIFPSISELFGTRAPPAPMSPAQLATAATATAAQAPGAPGSENSNPTVPNANTPSSDGNGPAAFPATKQGDASPLSNFKDIWAADPNAVGAPTLVPTMTADPAAMLAAAGKIDFTTHLDPAMLDKASKGDTASLAQLINKAAQVGYAHAATASVNITKAALTAQAESFETKYAPKMFRDASITDAVSQQVALASDPAAAPIVEAVKRQLGAKFPTASPAEIADMTNTYMTEFASKAVELAGGKVQTREQLTATTGGPLSRGEEDWGKFFDVPPNF